MERSSIMLLVNGNFKSVIETIPMKTIKSWRMTVLLTCYAASFIIDPLFMFIPVIDSHRSCVTFDKKLGVAVSVLRTFIDTFYVFHIIFHYITELIAPRPQISLFGEIIVQSEAIRKKHILLIKFIVDIVSVLPFPQVVFLTPIQRFEQYSGWLSVFLVWQHCLRISRIFLLEARTPIITVKTTQSVVFLFIICMLISYLIGTLWYVTAIQEIIQCWHDACARTSGCNLTDLYCTRGGGDNSRFLNTSCPLIDPAQITNSTVFNFGIFIDALKSGVVDIEPRDYPKKFLCCFWWGLRNISSLGQNLETSNSAVENLFAIFICVVGLVLFGFIIGMAQRLWLSPLDRFDEIKEKMRATEKWMSNRVLPDYLKERIRVYGYYNRQETRGIEEEAQLRSLPKDLRLETKRHLYLELLRRVSLFNNMDDGWLLEALCDRVKFVFYSANSYIVKEGDPVVEMLIVTKGELKSTTGSRVIDGDSTCSYLGAGGICGEVLLQILGPHPSSHLPTSDRTVMTHTNVEGLILSRDDVKFVASHISRLQSMKFNHMLRYISVGWRSWATCFIQAAWREHCKRKLCKNLRAERENLQAPQLSLGATSDLSSSSHVLTPVPHKPSDPEFLKDEADTYDDTRAAILYNYKRKGKAHKE